MNKSKNISMGMLDFIDRICDNILQSQREIRYANKIIQHHEP